MKAWQALIGEWRLMVGLAFVDVGVAFARVQKRVAPVSHVDFLSGVDLAPARLVRIASVRAGRLAVAVDDRRRGSLFHRAEIVA